MKKLFLLFVASLTMLFVGCSQFDDSRIWDAIDELEDLYDELDGRVEDLEEACEKMNTNIEALQTLVTALQNHDTITSIAPIKQGDEIIGYTISFSKSEPITIYHGTDGKDGADGEDGKDGADGEDGYTPTIGVAQDEDGAYYWTLDGEWLLDENGNKIKAVGTDGKDGEDGEDGANGNDGSNGENGENGADGKDGITPQLEIRDGYWYISYDNGATWKELGKATGEDGKDGADGEDGKDGEDGTNGTDGQDGKDGDSLFQSVTWDEEYAYFTLADGTVIKIPLASDSEAEEGDLPPANEIWYTSTDGEVVEPYCQMDWSGGSVFGSFIVSNTYENGKGVIVFDGNVTSIGDYAFYECSSLTSITIPDSVTSIGYEAFAACESLAEFRGKFASSDDRCLIIDGVLNSFAPAGLTEYTIPDSVTSIGDSAFAYCSSLTSITIPDSVTSIGDYAFFVCSSLTSVYCKPTTPPTLITDATWRGFWGTDSYEMIVYVPAECVTVYKSAEGWSDYSDLIMAEGSVVEATPPANEIWYTSTDGNVVTPYYTDVFGANIVSNTYEDGKGVITFDGDVTSIGDYAFNECTSLTSVTIPDSVTSIGYCAFVFCDHLSTVAFHRRKTPSIEWRAFLGCTSLVEFKGKPASEDGRCLIVDGVLTSFAPAGITEYTIPEGVTAIGESAFEDCTNLTNIVIVNGVTEIESQVFCGCSNLASVTIPEGVTKIGRVAFYECSSLTSITIPDSVTKTGDTVFKDCTSLTNVVIGNGMTEIAMSAFHGCTNLASVTIGSGVTSIEYLAFASCSSLASITIPEGVTKIGKDAFGSCSSLTSITIPEGVTSIGDSAFSFCRGLTSINIPEGVTDIEPRVFCGCSNLTSINIPEGVTSIGYNAFYGCWNLASITIPESVTEIDWAAFRECSSLTSIIIPESVTYIGDEAFRDCSSLAEVYCKATTPPSLGSYVFYNNASERKIYVPTESVDAYKTAYGWSDYADYIEPYNFGGGEGNAGVKEVAAVSLVGFYDVGDNFYVICGYVSSGEDAGYNPPMDSWNYEFNIISDTEPVNDEIPLGTYTYVDYEKLASGEEELKTGIFTIAGAWDMYCTYVDANGEMQEYKYTEGTMVVGEGKIELTVTLDNGEVHHVVYEGSLQTWGEAA